jgi:hypothetical protein
MTIPPFHFLHCLFQLDGEPSPDFFFSQGFYSDIKVDLADPGRGQLFQVGHG